RGDLGRCGSPNPDRPRQRAAAAGAVVLGEALLLGGSRPHGGGDLSTVAMKVLFLNPVGLVGGAERVLLDLFASLSTAEPSPGLPRGAPAGPLLVGARRLGAATTVLELPASVGAVGDSGLRGGPRAALSLARRAPAAAWSAWRAAGQLRRLVERL